MWETLDIMVNGEMINLPVLRLVIDENNVQNLDIINIICRQDEIKLSLEEINRSILNQVFNNEHSLDLEVSINSRIDELCLRFGVNLPKFSEEYYLKIKDVVHELNEISFNLMLDEIITFRFYVNEIDLYNLIKNSTSLIANDELDKTLDRTFNEFDIEFKKIDDQIKQPKIEINDLDCIVANSVVDHKKIESEKILKEELEKFSSEIIYNKTDEIKFSHIKDLGLDVVNDIEKTKESLDAAKNASRNEKDEINEIEEVKQDYLIYGALFGFSIVGIYLWTRSVKNSELRALELKSLESDLKKISVKIDSLEIQNRINQALSFFWMGVAWTSHSMLRLSIMFLRKK